jgi:hypothetical protein
VKAGTQTSSTPAERRASVPARFSQGPSPLAAAPTPEEIDSERSLWCPTYEQCLGVAFRNRWVSWTCASCSDFAHATPFRSLEAARAFGARRQDHPPDATSAPSLP